MMDPLSQLTATEADEMLKRPPHQDVLTSKLPMVHKQPSVHCFCFASV